MHGSRQFRQFHGADERENVQLYVLPVLPDRRPFEAVCFTGRNPFGRRRGDGLRHRVRRMDASRDLYTGLRGKGVGVLFSRKVLARRFRWRPHHPQPSSLAPRHQDRPMFSS
jgi:hypothetical protein